MLSGLKSRVSSPGGSVGLEPTHHGVIGGLHDVDPSQSHPRAAEVRANASPWGVISHLPELKPHLEPHGGA